MKNLDFSKLNINSIITIKWIALAFLLIVLIIDAFVFGSMIYKIGQAQNRRDKDAEAVSYFKNLVSQKDKLTHAQVFPQENIDSLLDKIQKIAGKNNIKVEIGTFLQPDKLDSGKDFFVYKDISVTASGSFKDLGIFLTTLKQLPDAVLDVGSMDLSDDKDDATIVKAQISLVVLTTKDDDNQ